jgi:Protein of unknown function (DUF2934)
MFEKEPAKSAAAKPKGKAAAAPRAKTTVTNPGNQAAGGKPAAANRRQDHTHERIQRRAYELWESEGRPAGREHAHWLQAEREIARTRAQRVAISQ